MKISVSNLKVYFALILALLSTGPWFLWYDGPILMLCSVSFIFLTLLTFPRRIDFCTKLSLVLCFILCFYLYCFRHVNTIAAISRMVCRLMPLCCVLLFNNRESVTFVKGIINLYSCLLLISVIFYVLYLIGLPLPVSSIASPDSFYPPFNNYYAFIVPQEFALIPRFQSVFVEPGHLGTVTAILLYLTHYDYKKWQVWILTIALVLSLSLAAYLLYIIGITIYKWAITQKWRRYIVVLAITMTVGVSLGMYLYKINQDSIISQMIFSRLEFDEENGFSGNNRNSWDFMNLYNKFIHSNDIILGIGSKKFSSLTFVGGNSSYRNFVLQNGLVGVGLLISFYLSVLIKRRSRLTIGLFILYVVSFIQRPYAMWEFESYIFIAYVLSSPRIKIYANNASNNSILLTSINTHEVNQ